jgi:capsular exopolysaccharide synthesis family protein
VDLRSCVRATRRRWWLLLLAVLAALGVATVANAVTVPQYATSVTFFVTTPSEGVTDSYQGGLFSQQRVKSYAALLAGDRLARAVAEEVGLSPEEVQSRVSARPVPDTVLLQAVVLDPDPARSERVARALSERFVELVGALETPAGGSSPAVKVDVVAGPTVDPIPVSPRPLRNLLLAGLVGLILGVGLALLREILDLTIKTAETLREVANAPLLAVVPFDATARKAPLATVFAPHSARAEAFRHLRTNLQFVDVDRPVKVIVVTSAVPDEGKSTTAVNLALAFAEAGKRTLLIEADLRRPKVAEYLGLEGAVGLSNVLAGQVDAPTVLQRWGPHALHVLPSGVVPPNPSELLGSRTMATLIDQFRDEFDIVVIDTPPILPVTDAAVVAAVADGAVMVTRAGRTAQARVRTALANLRSVDARVLGCVLNMQRVKGNVDYQYYSYSRTGDGRRGSRRGRDATGTRRAPAGVPAQSAGDEAKAPV